MTKTEFIGHVTATVLDYLPESYAGSRVEVTERAKNNDVMLHGLSIHGGKAPRFPSA